MKKLPIFTCPGAMRIKEPIPEFFKCPRCGSEVEIWTNENTRNCTTCGQVVYRDQVPTCIEWCKYGKECVGEEAYNDYMKGKKDRGDEKTREEEQRILKDLMEKCQRRSDLDGKKKDNKDR